MYDIYYNGEIDKLVEGSLGESLCTSMLHCFISTIAYGLKAPGGVTTEMPSPSYKDKEDYYLIWVFGLTFFIIVRLALFEMIFGVIVDTFADLRGKKEAIEIDIKEKCFICDIER